MKDIDWKNHLIEFVLIIAGILLALQINNWNEDRKDRRLEEQYLFALLLDVQSDIRAMENNLELTQRRSTIPLKSALRSWTAGYAIPMTDTTTFDLEGNPYYYDDPDLRFLAEVSHLAYVRVFQSNGSTFKDLISSGNSNILSDFALRAMLSSYYTEVDQVKYYQELILRDLINGMKDVTEFGVNFYDYTKLKFGGFENFYGDKDDARQLVQQVLDSERLKSEALQKLTLNGDERFLIGGLLETAKRLEERLLEVVRG